MFTVLETVNLLFQDDTSANIERIFSTYITTKKMY